MINLHLLSKSLLSSLVPIRHVCEIGVNEPDKCSLKEFIADGVRTTLVEPLPWCVENLRKAFPSANVIEGVVGQTSGIVRLYDRGEGSWIESVPQGKAPDEHPNHSAMKREAFEAQFVRNVRSYTFDEIDTGDIDILCVDTEGAEWFAIEKMRSRPRLIRLEMHFINSGWRNPFTDEINARLQELGYKRLMEDVSDVLWIR